VADIRLPFEFAPNGEVDAAKLQANFQALYQFITNVESKVEAFTNIKVADGAVVKLVTDDAGNVQKPSNPIFEAQMAGSQALGSTGDLVFDTQVIDIGGVYNPTTYTFTAPVDGTYAFTLKVFVIITNGTGGFSIAITGPSGTLSTGALPSPTGNWVVTLTAYATLTATQTVKTTYSKVAGTIAATVQATSQFSGTLVG
jgi:hypothetical protein